MKSGDKDGTKSVQKTKVEEEKVGHQVDLSHRSQAHTEQSFQWNEEEVLDCEGFISSEIGSGIGGDHSVVSVVSSTNLDKIKKANHEDDVA